nr:immunoglobulin heavy chain junction region [Macaca mulatta]MOX92227.1 immunoglobulin heavy chain junction region [Macaca mulatta]MOX92524.1 immunoglobulin heavy chain junction region [Macaca mulatta]MOX93309.1 immunoglobulin heavy chain junction region [Macaca mulatta]MOX93735.1 immunoglobulin heavy chain junction region [Macaca mulatta]
CTSGRIAAAYW